MIRSLYSAASGMQSEQTNIDVIANNLANVNTTGFKKSLVLFEDVLYQTDKQPAARLANGANTPGSLQIGFGSKPVATAKNFSQGDLVNTGNIYDLAIQGRGFFKVELADGSGLDAYTRDGSFKLNQNGQIVTNDGLTVVGLPQIPQGTTDVTIGPNGIITTTTNNQQQQLGQVNISDFINPDGLKQIGGNLYTETDASGPPQDGPPGLEGRGTLQQNYLENSNVRVVDEMVRLIQAQRAYEVNSKTIQAADEMMSQANNLRR
jgi:flagellar basal-body rod protein FlgG